MLGDGYGAGPGFLWLVRVFALIALGGALGGIAFVAAQATKATPKGGDDRNWNFLFLCWSDAVAIWILYVAVDFSWLFQRLVAILRTTLPLDGVAESYFTSEYLVLVIELICYALVMGIAVRLFLRIRRFLDPG